MPAFREIDVRLRVLNARQFRSELIASGAGVRRFEGSTRTVAQGIGRGMSTAESHSRRATRSIIGGWRSARAAVLA